jgi:hypothetical protein
VDCPPSVCIQSDWQGGGDLCVHMTVRNVWGHGTEHLGLLEGVRSCCHQPAATVSSAACPPTPTPTPSKAHTPTESVRVQSTDCLPKTQKLKESDVVSRRPARLHVLCSSFCTLQAFMCQAAKLGRTCVHEFPRARCVTGNRRLPVEVYSGNEVTVRGKLTQARMEL